MHFQDITTEFSRLYESAAKQTEDMYKAKLKLIDGLEFLNDDQHRARPAPSYRSSIVGRYQGHMVHFTFYSSMVLSEVHLDQIYLRQQYHIFSKNLNGNTLSIEELGKTIAELASKRNAILEKKKKLDDALLATKPVKATV